MNNARQQQRHLYVQKLAIRSNGQIHTFQSFSNELH